MKPGDASLCVTPWCKCPEDSQALVQEACNPDLPRPESHWAPEMTASEPGDSWITWSLALLRLSGKPMGDKTLSGIGHCDDSRELDTSRNMRACFFSIYSFSPQTGGRILYSKFISGYPPVCILTSHVHSSDGGLTGYRLWGSKLYSNNSWLSLTISQELSESLYMLYHI